MLACWKPSEDCKVTLKFHMIYITKQIQSSLGIKAGICLVDCSSWKEYCNLFPHETKGSFVRWTPRSVLELCISISRGDEAPELREISLLENWRLGKSGPRRGSVSCERPAVSSGRSFPGGKTGKRGGRGNCHCWTRFYPEFTKHHLNTRWSWKVSGLKLATLMDFFGWSLFKEVCEYFIIK